LSPDEKNKVADVLTKHIQQADLIITTASIPGHKSNEAKAKVTPE